MAKSTTASISGSFCERFLAMLNLGRLFKALVEYFFDSDGNISTEFAADLCALNCGSGSPGGGTGTGSGALTTPTLTASDGSYSDKVALSWTLISGATYYEVYRNTTNDSAGATLIGSPTATTYNDTSIVAGTLYYYWVKARNTTQSSGLSGVDTGYASAALTAVSDLDVSKGIQNGVASTPYLSLVWTKVTDANAWDIYRSATTNFADASLIAMDRAPYDNTRNPYPCFPTPCTQPVFVDNGGNELLYIDSPPNPTSKWYYWVKPKKIASGTITAVGGESNRGDGWCWGSGGNGTTGLPLVSGSLTVNGQTFTFPAGVTKCWIVLIGSGAGGAGGDAAYGGGGGGSGPIFSGLITVAVGKKIKLVTGSAAAAGGAGSANGTNAATDRLQYDGTGVFVDMFSTTPATAGQYNGAGSGAGGAGGTGTVDAAVSSSFYKAGRSGEAGSGTRGGRGGSYWGGYKQPANHLDGSALSNYGNAGSGNGASGSDAIPSSPASASGGSAAIAQAYFTYYAA